MSTIIEKANSLLAEAQGKNGVVGRIADDVKRFVAVWGKVVAPAVRAKVEVKLEEAITALERALAEPAPADDKADAAPAVSSVLTDAEELLGFGSLVPSRTMERAERELKHPLGEVRTWAEAVKDAGNTRLGGQARRSLGKKEGRLVGAVRKILGREIPFQVEHRITPHLATLTSDAWPGVKVPKKRLARAQAALDQATAEGVRYTVALYRELLEADKGLWEILRRHCSVCSKALSKEQLDEHKECCSAACWQEQKRRYAVEDRAREEALLEKIQKGAKS